MSVRGTKNGRRSMTRVMRHFSSSRNIFTVIAFVIVCIAGASPAHAEITRWTLQSITNAPGVGSNAQITVSGFFDYNTVTNADGITNAIPNWNIQVTGTTSNGQSLSVDFTPGPNATARGLNIGHEVDFQIQLGNNMFAALQLSTSGQFSVPEASLTIESSLSLFEDGAVFDNLVGSLVNGTPVLVVAANNLGVADASLTTGCGCTASGEPVNAGTGNEFETEVDFTGAPNTGLGLTRYYNSQDTTKSAFGTGWHSTWHHGLAFNNNVVTVTHASGSEDTFTNNGSGVYVPSPNVTSTLVPVTSGGALTAWKLTLADDMVEMYLPNGDLASVTTRNGFVTNLSYDANNNLVSVTGPFGAVMSFTYDPVSKNVTTMTDPTGAVYAYAYDANNNLVSVTYPNNTKRQYVYENTSFVNALTGIIDELGNRYVTVAYDAQERAISTQFAGGAGLTTLAYNSDGSTSVTDANGNTHTFNFTTEFGLVDLGSVTGAPVPSAGGSAFTYDSNGFVASKTDYDGNVTTYTHDARGDETSRTEASGTPLARTTTTTWLSTFHLPTQITEPNGRVTTFAYDTHGNLLTKIVTAGTQVRHWTFTYNANGQVLTATDPDGHLTTMTYDAKGNMATATDALGHIASFTSYDADGRLLSSTDPNELITTFTYDTRGRLLSHTTGTEVTASVYDAASNLTKLIRPDGSFQTYVYDQAHRLTHVVDALNNQLAFALDGNSNRTNISAFNPSQVLTQTRSFTYDDVNHLAQEIGASSQTTDYAYDAQGNLTGVTDPLDHTNTFSFDALNRKVQNTNPLNGHTGFGYDVVDRLIAESDPRSLTTGYSYDGLDNQTALNSPDAGDTTRIFDAAGNVLTSIDARGKKTVYSYDALNRPVEALYADGTRTLYEYDQGKDGIGHLTKMIDPSGETSFTYDQHGRLTQKAQTTGDLTLVTRRAYDNFGRLASLTYPSGRVVNVGYDANGKVKALTEGRAALVSGVLYRPFGPANVWTQGNGATLTRAFDYDGRIVSIGNGADTLTYTYDAASRITALTETGEPNQSFGYDALDRITNFVDGTATTAYAYDADGNRLQLSEPTAASSSVYAYAANSNHLLQQVTGTGPRADADAFAYDSSGNTLSDSDHAYTYNARGRMESASTLFDDNHPRWWHDLFEAHLNERFATSYAINGLGERVGKFTHDGATIYTYDESGHLLGEYDGQGRTIEEIVYLNDIPVAVLGNGGECERPDHGRNFGNAANAYYIMADNIGAPHTVTDARNRIVWHWAHAPFGDTQPVSVDGFTLDMRNQGQIADKETGTFDNGLRTYFPRDGRYGQSDPIGLLGGVNTYGYVGQNPVSRIDPNGQAAWGGAITGGLIGGGYGGLGAYIANGDIYAISGGIIAGAFSGAVTGYYTPTNPATLGIIAGGTDLLGQYIAHSMADSAQNMCTPFRPNYGSIAGSTLSGLTLGISNPVVAAGLQEMGFDVAAINGTLAARTAVYSILPPTVGSYIWGASTQNMTPIPQGPQMTPIPVQ